MESYLSMAANRPFLRTRRRLCAKVFLTAVTLCFLAQTGWVQLSTGGRPLSYSLGLSSDLPTEILPEVNVDSLLAVDEIEEADGLGYRFGFPIPVAYDLGGCGIWDTLEDGSRLWRFRFKSAGAVTININYDRFWLPEGATYFVFNPNDTSQVIGAFTEANNKPYGKMATGMVRGDEMVLEYFVPAALKQSGELSISSIVHGYKGVGAYWRGFGDALPCHNDVNCEEGEPYKDQIRSVVMYTYPNSNNRLCSGVLINNVEKDRTPYILTAWHCLRNHPDTALHTYYFNYQKALCDSVIDGTLDYSLVGSVSKAKGDTTRSDFELVILDDTIPTSFNVYFAGWSSINKAADSTFVIHHPRGDVKKISLDNSPPLTDGWSTPGTHWRTELKPYYGEGAVEVGSSGAPLFDQCKRVVGQHTGERISDTNLCNDPYTLQRPLHGKFAISWDTWPDSTEQLRHWLDPDNTGKTFLDGLDPNEGCCVGIRGDVDYNGQDEPNIADLVYLVDYLYNSGPIPQCTEEGNVDGDANENIDEDDRDCLVDYLFGGGPPPPNCPSPTLPELCRP